jgi:hypothetical protein
MAVAMLTAIVGLFFAGVADALHASYHKLDASRDGSARNSAHGEPVHAALEPTPMRVHGNSSDAGVDSHRQLRLTSIPTLHNVPRAARDPQATANRLGAFFGPTDPYVGPSADYSWSTGAKTQLRVSACAALAASVDRHTAWFKGHTDETHRVHDTRKQRSASPSKVHTRAASIQAASRNATASGSGPTFRFRNNQQDAQRDFLAAIPTTLCAEPRQTDDQYYRILHAMLAEVRTHINRHVHSAFWVKATCAELHGDCFANTPANPDAADPYNRVIDELLQPDKVALAGTHDRDRLPDLHSCVAAVLYHEKYNLVGSCRRQHDRETLGLARLM